MRNQMKVGKDKTHTKINTHRSAKNRSKSYFICYLFSPLTSWKALQVSEGGQLRERPACLSHQSAGNQCNLLIKSSHLACSPGIISPQIDGVQSTFIPVCLRGHTPTVTRAEKTNRLSTTCLQRHRFTNCIPSEQAQTYTHTHTHTHKLCNLNIKLY